MARNVNKAISERIRVILNDVFHGNVSAMAKATYINRNTLNSIVGKKEVKPGYDVIRRIVEMSTPQISIDWLITGNGEMMETKPIIDMTRHNSNGDNAGGNIFKIVDPETLKAEEETICALKNEVAHLKALLQERERVIAEKERFIQHLLDK